jgi:hypothetical protein
MAYFDSQVLWNRPYLQREWCIGMPENPISSASHDKNRYRFWERIAELEGAVLRVATLEAQITIHDAFVDQGFKP